jgi:hypothetical protein
MHSRNLWLVFADSNIPHSSFLHFCIFGCSRDEEERAYLQIRQGQELLQSQLTAKSSGTLDEQINRKITFEQI